MSSKRLTPEQAPRPQEAIQLPESFISTLHAFPALKPLLIALAHQDSATFMHSMAVHEVVSRLIRDLCLRYQLPAAIQDYLENLLPFVLLHDIGKGGTHKNPEIAKIIVHPIDDLDRPVEEIAYHWLHSEIGYDMLLTWGEQFSNGQQMLISQWAELTRQHQPEMYEFLARDKSAQHILPHPIVLPPWAKLMLTCFRMGDTSAAAALPRPNNLEVDDYTYLVAHIHWLCHRLKPEHIVGEENAEELAHFITASITQTLQELQATYQTADWLCPTGFTNPEFQLTVSPSPENIQPLLYLTYQAWRRAEQRWDATIRLMENDGALSFSKEMLEKRRKKRQRQKKN